MSKIISYIVKSQPSINDKIIGSNSEKNVQGLVEDQTVQFPISNLQSLILGSLTPISGGQLKITEIAPTTTLTNISTIVNALSPAYVVGKYETLFFNINGHQYLLKSQDLAIGVGGTVLTNNDFVDFPVSVGATGANGANGANGVNGTNGKEIELRASGNFIQWKYTTDLTWTNLIDIQGLKGDDGVSITASSNTTTVTGNGSILTPYKVEVNAGSTWVVGEVRIFSDVSPAWLTANFNLVTGVGINAMNGWVIAGTNGTRDRRGRTSIAYDNRSLDPSNNIWDILYNTLGSLIGLKRVKLTGSESGIQSHAHGGIPAFSGNVVPNTGTGQYYQGLGANTSIVPNTDAIDFHENRQPSIVDIWAIKIA
jgi:hypothetical protein